MTDRAIPLFPTERVVALMLSIATLHSPSETTRALAAEHLTAVIYSTSAEQIYRSTFGAVLFASGVLRSANT